MRRVEEHEGKPLGWFWYTAKRDTPNGKLYQGRLRIQANEHHFREWFFLIPFVGIVLTVGHYKEEASWSSSRSQ